ncbi:SPOR domain-containing protein [Thiohalomonas denitrificans]|uniref:Sporulation related domain-containing protein n=1 Tax=Thiohalomonas denitrificans TaxID=415747 RepID=A0A1G5R542_9GAMM|nr:SPOR domain-containing protein [Thiohalomonas denitrificans]SCZ68429.1 Sporulation related domain-containing protein [Thiohalomonas denitrificans]
MRALFLLLIAANLAYFAWEGVYRPRQTPPPEVKMPAVESPGGTLTLLSEAPVLPDKRVAGVANRDPAVAEAPEQAEALPSETEHESPVILPPECYRIAGFREATDADALTAAIQQNGARLSGRGASQMTRRNHWVLIPPVSSRTDARRVIRELQAFGMNDFYLVRNGEYANAISLGVFSTEAAALQRLKRIRALSLSGPNPRLDRKEMTAKRYWVEVQWSGAEEPPWENLVSENPEIDVTRISCRSPR